jgi:hypothetical protein
MKGVGYFNGLLLQRDAPISIHPDDLFLVAGSNFVAGHISALDLDAALPGLEALALPLSFVLDQPHLQQTCAVRILFVDLLALSIQN